MVLLLPFETDPFRFYFKIKSDDGGSSFLLILSSQSNTIYWIIPPFPHNLSYTKFSYVVFFFSSWDYYHGIVTIIPFFLLELLSWKNVKKKI